jgi:hypothetical protein
MPDYCQIHLGPRGLEYKTRDSAIVEFQETMRKAAIDQFVVHDKREVSKRLAEQLAARQRLSQARFFSFRDASHLSEDIVNDKRPGRKPHGFSITRDMLEGPQHNVNVIDLNRGLDSRSVGHVGHDRYRFAYEADRLRMLRLIDERDMPEWDSDESIFEFLCKVYDMALEEATDYRRTGVNRVIDNAPGLYLFTELLKRSEKVIEEDFTGFWARSIFPIMDLNTWLPQWLYERRDDRGVFPQVVDVEYLSGNVGRGSENRAAVPRPLVYWHTAASWSGLELARHAEAVANGSTNIALDQSRINTAIRMMNWMEDIFAWFGNDDLDIHGVFSPEAKTGIERVPSGGGFGSGNPEDDRALLTREVKLIRNNTGRALTPNTLMLSTASWDYVVEKRYGDETNNSNESILETAEYALRKLGVTDILWIPEVGWRDGEQKRLADHGVPAAEAERLAGGLDGEQCMVTMRRDPNVAEMVVAKNRVMYPARETVNDRIEARMLQGGGGMVFYKPEAVKITTDVGPA